MAKRKRLSPATIMSDSMAPETKSALNVEGQGARRAPIADVTGDAAKHFAFEEVTDELRRARIEGRMVVRLPLSVVEAGHLVRDRIAADPEEMAILKDSLCDRGQQTPIEVVELGAGRYGLISGWRRLMALQDLSARDPDAFGFVLALVRVPDTAADAYRAMVEENEIRADLSFYERARIAVQSARQGVYLDTKLAVQSLFSAARAPKRSKILSFAVLVDALDDYLRFPTAIPEKLGLPLVAALQGDVGFKRSLIKALHKAAPQDAAAERRVLERALKGRGDAQRPKPDNRGEEIVPGVRMEIRRGRLVLAGRGIDDALIEDLRQWLLGRCGE